MGGLLLIPFLYVVHRRRGRGSKVGRVFGRTGSNPVLDRLFFRRGSTSVGLLLIYYFDVFRSFVLLLCVAMPLFANQFGSMSGHARQINLQAAQDTVSGTDSSQVAFGLTPSSVTRCPTLTLTPLGARSRSGTVALPS
jgi:hypothetical protein